MPFRNPGAERRSSSLCNTQSLKMSDKHSLYSAGLNWRLYPKEP